MTSAPKQSGRKVCLGVIGAPHGVRGQVKLRSFTEIPDDIIAYGPLFNEAGESFTISIVGHTQDALIASIEGITDRTQVEKLRNMRLFVSRETLPETEQNQYYHEDLVGLSLRTADGQPFGELIAMHNFGAGDLAEVKFPSGKTEYYPFNREVFPTIDIQQGFAVIEPPEYVAGDIE